MYSCLPRRPKKNKYQRVLNTKVNFSSPVIFPDQKENLESSGEILWHEILHEILADCSVWVSAASAT